MDRFRLHSARRVLKSVAGSSKTATQPDADVPRLQVEAVVYRVLDSWPLMRHKEYFFESRTTPTRRTA